MELFAFGYFRILDQGRDRTDALPARFRRLLAHLALRAERVDRRVLAAELRPEHERSVALANLRRHVHGLRFGLAAAGFAEPLDVTDDSIALAPAMRRRIDVARYVDGCSGGLSDRASSEAYAEPVFPVEDDEWLRAARERLRGVQRESLTRALDDAFSRGDVRDIERLAAASVDLDPLREETARRAIRALAGLGEVARAKQVFARLAARLRREYEAEPEDQTMRLIEQLHERHASTSGLPPELSPFVGREREIASVLEAAASERAVTITGTIGVGKSRVLRRAAEALGSAHLDGVRYLDGSTFGSIDALRAALADLLHASSAEMGALAGAIRARDVLLVFDNVDAFMRELPELCDALLRASPSSSLLSSSRGPLGMSVERIVPIEPLGLPPAFADARTIAAAPAVQFFVSRAVAAGARDVRSRDTLLAIADVCRELDGLPRALELAAQRLPLLGATSLRRLVADRFAVLGSAARSVENAYASSYEDLEPAARATLRRLCLVRGAWDVERLGAYCGVEHGKLEQVLASLVERSVLTVDESGRYRLLRSMRDYLGRRLSEAGEREAMELRYAEAVLAPLVARNDALRGPSAFAAFDGLEREMDDVRAALDIAIIDGRARELGVRALCALSRFHFESGRVVEALRWYAAALEREIVPAALRAEVLYLHAVLGRNQLSFDASLERFERALDVLRTDGEAETTAKALLYAANCARMAGKVATARTYAREARRSFAARGDRYLEGFAATAMAAAEYGAGNLEDARREFLFGVECFREFGARGDEALALASVGRCFFGAGDLARAEGPFASALQVALASGNQYAEAHARLSLALLALDRAEPGAESHLVRAAVIALGAADVELSIIVAEAVGEALVAAGRFERAAASLASADAARRAAAAVRAPTEASRYRAARAALAERALAVTDPTPAPALASVLGDFVRSSHEQLLA